MPTSPTKSTGRASGKVSNSLAWLLVRGRCVQFVKISTAKFDALGSGESGLGKSTLINTLFNTTLYPFKEPLPPTAERPKTVAIESIGAGIFSLKARSSRFVHLICVDIEENGVRLHLNVVDTPGFGDFVNNDDR